MTVTDASVPTVEVSQKSVAERVLIVEDDTAARVGLEQLVKSWGFVADSAADGEEALEKVTTFRPAIVISDLVMPRMDGLALLRSLQQQGAALHPATDFIACEFFNRQLSKPTLIH